MVCPIHGKHGARFVKMVPTMETDAAPPQDGVKMIILAGAIKHWWDENWDTSEHWEYAQWRHEVSAALVAAGYLVYRPHEAFKGTWSERAQAVNDAAIAAADLMLILSEKHVPSEGTDVEEQYALRVGTPVLRITSKQGINELLDELGKFFQI